MFWHEIELLINDIVDKFMEKHPIVTLLILLGLIFIVFMVLMKNPIPPYLFYHFEEIFFS